MVTGRTGHVLLPGVAVSRAVAGNSPALIRRHYAVWLPGAHPEAVEFDTPDGAVPMDNPAVANLQVEAERRGLRVVRAE